MASPAAELGTATGVLPTRPRCVDARNATLANGEPFAVGQRVQACHLCEPRSFNCGGAWRLRSDPEQAPLGADQRAAVFQRFKGMHLAERGAFNVVDGFQTRIGSEYAVLGPQQPVAAFERLHVANRAENRSLDG